MTDRKKPITRQNDVLDIMRKISAIDEELNELVMSDMDECDERGEKSSGHAFVVAEEASPELDGARSQLQEVWDDLDKYQRELLK